LGTKYQRPDSGGAIAVIVENADIENEIEGPGAAGEGVTYLFLDGVGLVFEALIGGVESGTGNVLEDDCSGTSGENGEKELSITAPGVENAEPQSRWKPTSNDTLALSLPMAKERSSKDTGALWIRSVEIADEETGRRRRIIPQRLVAQGRGSSLLSTSTGSFRMRSPHLMDF